jgi:hypothetical protein
MINIRIILFFFIATLGVFLLLRIQGRLETKEAPLGIVSLELASTTTEVKSILKAWETEAMISTAKNNILLDFLFIPLYSLIFYTLCGSISVRTRRIVAKMGVVLAFGAVIAGLFDVFENILMLLSLNDHYNYLTVLLTAFFAVTKFILLGLALLYVIPVGIVVIIRKLIYGDDYARG